MTSNRQRPTILIVDDSPEYATILIETLCDEFSTLIATSGERALAMARAEPAPDLILLDVVMSGMSGYEVCARLKDSARTAHIPVIFMTALDAEQDEQRGLDLGAVDYITKPFRPALVRTRIANQLDLKRHRDRLEEMVRERTREVTLTQDAAIYGLGMLAEFRDSETGAHIRRTQSYVGLLARHLQGKSRFAGFFDESTIELLVKSAPLHDIGKVGIQDRILHKSGPLTASEFDEIKQHTLFGRQVVDRIEAAMHDSAASAFLRFAKEVTYTHHEHWDGTGYHGLKQEQIPVSGRLMALADVYDALISRRVYKPALAHQQALQIICQGDDRTRPEHFDPDVLQAFLEINDQFESISVSLRD